MADKPKVEWEPVDRHLARLRVEGGWLYRHQILDYGGGNAVAMCFVPFQEEKTDA